MSASLREIAELHLYDGDTDRPLPGYQALYDLADRLDATVCVPLDGLADKLNEALRQAEVDRQLAADPRCITGTRNYQQEADTAVALLQSLAVTS